MEAQPREIGRALAPIPSSPSPVYQRITKFIDGVPTVVAVPMLTKQNLRDIYLIAASQPYVVEDPFDPEFEKYDGMTCAEVMVRKEIEQAARLGDMAAAEKIMDRIIGRPEQISKTLEVSASYEEWLKSQAGPVINVSPVPPGPEDAGEPW